MRKTSPPNPLRDISQLVCGLARLVQPLGTCFVEPYGQAEAAWQQHRHQARDSAGLFLAARRWFLTNLDSSLLSEAEGRLSRAERALTEFANCPIPFPGFDISWCQDASGNLHTPTGSSGPEHKQACARLQQTARAALDAVYELRNLEGWVGGTDDGAGGTVDKPGAKRGVEKGPGNPKLRFTSAQKTEYKRLLRDWKKAQHSGLSLGQFLEDNFVEADRTAARRKIKTAQKWESEKKRTATNPRQ